jgi:hypothetical protein
VVGFGRWLSALAIAGTVLGACSSDQAETKTSKTNTSGTTVAETVPAAANSATTGATAAAGQDGSTPGAPASGVEFCSTIPDAAAVEAAIGVAVKSPLSVGDQQVSPSCTYLRSADDFPGISFYAHYDHTLAQETAFVKTNFGADITPLDAFPGFSRGPGDAVYYEAGGNLYSAQATFDGDGVVAAVKLLQVWLGV